MRLRFATLFILLSLLWTGESCNLLTNGSTRSSEISKHSKIRYSDSTTQSHVTRTGWMHSPVNHRMMKTPQDKPKSADLPPTPTPAATHTAPSSTTATSPSSSPLAAPLAASNLANDFGCFARYESGNTNDPPGNGYSGYFQFTQSSWWSASGLPGNASDYPYAIQLAAAEKWIAMCNYNWHGQWPNSSRMCGL